MHPKGRIQVSLNTYLDFHFFFQLMCWGYRSRPCTYVGLQYNVEGMLNNPHAGGKWWPEPKLVCVVDERPENQMLKGAFRHAHCKRFSSTKQPWESFMCQNAVTKVRSR